MTNEPKHFADLRALGFEPTTDATLMAAPVITEAAKPTHVPASTTNQVVLAPPGQDPRLMSVDEIELDVRLLDNFKALDFDKEGRAAYDYVFSLYRSYGRNKERNGALGRKITSFITNVRRNRVAPGMVSQEIKSTKEERDLAAVIASQGVDAGELAQALRIKQALEAAGVDIASLLTN